jgi:hypothetical protein
MPTASQLTHTSWKVGRKFILVAHLGTKPQGGIYSPDGFAMVDPGGGNYPVVKLYRAGAIVQRNSRVKLDADVSGLTPRPQNKKIV